MNSIRKPKGTFERKFTNAAFAEWTRSDYDYSNLWFMFDNVAAAGKASGEKRIGAS